MLMESVTLGLAAAAAATGDTRMIRRLAPKLPTKMFSQQGDSPGAEGGQVAVAALTPQNISVQRAYVVT